MLSPDTGIEAWLHGVGFPNAVFDWIVQPKQSLYALAVVAVWHGTGFVMAMFIAGLRSVGESIFKAAMIDAASLPRIDWRIVLPTAQPILVVVAIMQVTAIWRDFLFAPVLAPSDQPLVTVGLNNLTNVQEVVHHHNVYMAAALICGLPTLLRCIVAGKYFVRGLTAGAVKGQMRTSWQV